jgi:hypothetical protein
MRKIFLLIVFIVFNGCQINSQTKFNKEKWLIKKGSKFLYRNEMLNDLVENFQLNGLTKNELIELLGKSENMNKNDKELFYPILQKYDEPNHIIFLVIRINKKEIVDYFKIIDNRKLKNKNPEITL